ncbi:MAG: ATP-binding protein [Verrucomicrobiota bacterium]
MKDLLTAFSSQTQAPRWLEAGIAVVDEQNRVLRLDHSLAEWFGIAIEEAVGRELAPLLAERCPDWPGQFAAALRERTGFSTFEVVDAGSKPSLWLRCEVTVGPGCRFVRLASVLPPLQELSESGWEWRLRSDAARQQLFVRMMRAEAQLQSITQRWPGVIFSQRADFSFSFASSRIEELTGFSVEQLRHQPGLFWRLVHEADVGELQSTWRRLDRLNPTASMTYRIRHATTGRVAYLMESREAIFSESGLLLGYEGVWLDVTRQTIAERRLSSAAWKETIAVLTMGLAHDFSNIMSGIHALSESFGAEVSPGHPLHDGLALIRQNSMQASQLVRRILSLHNDKAGEQNYHNLNEIAADTVELMRKTMPRRVAIHLELAPESLALYVDAVELRQVIINLIVNAVDSMPEGGRLTVTTSLHDALPLENLRLGQVGRLPAVCLTVKDTGCGIPASQLNQIFDPFFTTKPVNKGSGLGLYNARLFLEKHRGAISVDSMPGAGTTFRLWLPLADFTDNDRVAPAGTAVRHTVLLLGSGGQALERMVQYLREHGFYVVACLTPESAHQALASGQYQFAVILGFGDRDNRWIWQLLSEARQNRLPVKTAVQIVGCNIDELDTRSLTGLDAVFSPDTPASEVLAGLQPLLAAAPA